MNKISQLFSLLFLIAFCSCAETTPETFNQYSFQVKGLTDQEYPDNPDYGFCAQDYNYNFLSAGVVKVNPSQGFSLTFSSPNDTIRFANLDLMEFIPTIPNHLKSDEYLSLISIVNQEWNRNQVKFNRNSFTSSNPEITRIDVARNCLNAYLWEIILYKLESEKEVPFAHGWFDFPKELYQDLFLTKNGVSFSTYQSSLENWVDPPSNNVNKEALRTVINGYTYSFYDYSSEMYPLQGARLKKQKEIIYPTRVEVMQDFHTDSALFATFTPPGFYNKADPRKTELGRLASLNNVEVNTIIAKANGDTLSEIIFHFTDENRTTKLVFGGIDISALPLLTKEGANDGWKNSMGFSNHTFYETYDIHVTTKTAKNPYYAYFTDEKGNWLDSHKIGVDGPVMHWDKENPNLLHVWLLSFERHALVGHYVIDFSTQSA